MGCQSCLLEKVRFVKEETASRKAGSHLFPGLSYMAKRDCLEAWLNLFLKVIDLKSSFLV